MNDQLARQGDESIREWRDRIAAIPAADMAAEQVRRRDHFVEVADQYFWEQKTKEAEASR